ncbi:MAG: hypothetical protein EA412_12635 [Chitinophagaceae bacterium]|nr:MAG: hypothetical protein EA412_12635 [Chitinophagaceae bacterium]
MKRIILMLSSIKCSVFYILLMSIALIACNQSDEQLQDDGGETQKQQTEQVSRKQQSFHEEVKAMSMYEREYKVKSLYEKVVESGEKRQFYADVIRSRRAEIAPNYPNPNDLASDGMHLMDQWYANYPNEVADYILFIENLFKEH